MSATSVYCWRKDTASLPALLRRGVIEPAAALISGRLPRRSRLWQAKNFLQGASPARSSTVFALEHVLRARARRLNSIPRSSPSACATMNAETWFLQKLEP